MNKETIDAMIALLNSLKDVPATDFEEGESVLVEHYRHDGTRVITTGTVTDIQMKDDDGYYTRITADNGKHYRTGLHIGEERKGSTVLAKVLYTDGDTPYIDNEL